MRVAVGSGRVARAVESDQTGQGGEAVVGAGPLGAYRVDSGSPYDGAQGQPLAEAFEVGLGLLYLGVGGVAPGGLLLQLREEFGARSTTSPYAVSRPAMMGNFQVT